MIKQKAKANNIKLLAVLTLMAQSTASPASTNSATHDHAEWTDLFNGTDLSGWTMKFAGSPINENYKNTFRVRDGILQVSYDKYDDFKGEFGHLFYDTSYSNYRLRFDYRFTGEQTPGGPRWAFRNSGVMVHSQSAESMTQAQDFPVSIEVQLLGQTGKNERPTGNVCTPGTHIILAGKLEKEHCINSTSPTYRGDSWVTAEVEVLSNQRIRHFINGELVIEYTHPQLDTTELDTQHLLAKGSVKDMSLKNGFIAFQAESHPVEFKNIQIKEIKE